jgi:hypothetical protein
MSENWEKILEENYKNIRNILKQPSYNEILNMKTNKICKKIKRQNKYIPDLLIQAHVLSLMQILVINMWN